MGINANFDFFIRGRSSGFISVFLLFLFICNFPVQIQGERVLTSPRVTDWGQWGPWEYCRSETFVTGMQLYTHPHQGIFRDDRGLTGLRLFCNHFGKKTESHSIKSNIDVAGKWGKKYFCSGQMTGFQLRSEKHQSVFVDDTATNNVRMFCDHKESYLQGDGTSFGHWTEKRLCGSHEAICGIRTQVEKAYSWDMTGINNIMMKCCDIPIPHPNSIENCVPKTTWERVTFCDASHQYDKNCSYTRKVGISYLEKYSGYVSLHDANGYGLRKTASRFQSRFLNTSSTYGSYEVLHKDTKDHYWFLSPSYIWEPEISENAKVIAKKGTKIELYQIVGKCGMLQIWGTRMKKVDTAANTKAVVTTFFDFSNEHEMEYLSLNLVN